jgi:hypothetical protein
VKGLGDPRKVQGQYAVASGVGGLDNVLEDRSTVMEGAPGHGVTSFLVHIP